MHRRQSMQIDGFELFKTKSFDITRGRKHAICCQSTWSEENRSVKHATSGPETTQDMIELKAT